MLTRKIADLLVPMSDWILAPLVWLSALLMRMVRRLGIWRLPLCRRIFNRVGIYPLRDHYYEPMYNYTKHLSHSLRDVRSLPGIDLNEHGQVAWLSRFHYADELKRFPRDKVNGKSFHFDNPNFSEGDAECLYSIIRLNKPKRIIEIGSGFSTLMARAAIERNQAEDASDSCRHVCIEPYEMAWLNDVPGIEVMRQRVEFLGKQVFLELEAGDILFVDSSHVIRPQGDVLCEVLEILPILKPGVLVHFHDIFTPRDYLDHWFREEVKMWNEQYLLEAFLSCNSQYRIVLALNHLWYAHRDEMIRAFPMLGMVENPVEPRSIWIEKR